MNFYNKINKSKISIRLIIFIHNRIKNFTNSRNFARNIQSIIFINGIDKKNFTTISTKPQLNQSFITNQIKTKTLN